MDIYQEIIKECFMQVEKKYYLQDTITNNRSKYNERVFCYEFYHQLRLCQEKKNLTNLTFSGEAVKSNFQFKNIIFNKTPDILLHNFGTHADNEVVIEVKKTKVKSAAVNGVIKDFQTLDTLTHGNRNNSNYKLGILILFHFDFIDLAKNNEVLLEQIIEIINNNNRIIVWSIPKLVFDNNNKLKDSCLKVYSNDDLRRIFLQN